MLFLVPTIKDRLKSRQWAELDISNALSFVVTNWNGLEPVSNINLYSLLLIRNGSFIIPSVNSNFSAGKSVYSFGKLSVMASLHDLISIITILS